MAKLQSVASASLQRPCSTRRVLNLPPFPMPENYYDLFELSRKTPHWKLCKQLYAVVKELKEAYGEVLPGDFEIPLETLLDSDAREQYDSFLEWAEEDKELDFGAHAERNIDIAERIHHFRAERLENGRVLFSNRGFPDPPPPPPPPGMSSDNEPTRPVDMEAGAEFFPSYYEALGLKRFCDDSLLRPALAQKERDVWGPRYGGGGADDIPPALSALYKTCGEPDLLYAYKGFLKASLSQELVDFNGDVQAGHTAAQMFHFEFQPISQSKAVFRNVGFVLPAGKDAGRTTSRSRSTASPAPDDFGRVNRECPPVVIGNHVYRVLFGEGCVLEWGHDFGHSMELRWCQTVNGQQRHFSHMDFIAPKWGDGPLRAQRVYTHLKFEDTITREQTTEAYIGNVQPFVFPIVTGHGLWNYFPWHAEYLKLPPHVRQAQWNKNNPGRPLPPDSHFDAEPGWTDYVVRGFATYLEEVSFWGRAYIAQFRGSAIEARQRAKMDASKLLKNLAGFKPREIRKLGLPDPPR